MAELLVVAGCRHGGLAGASAREVLRPLLPSKQTTPHKFTQHVNEFNDTLPPRASPLLLAVVVLLVIGHFPMAPQKSTQL